MGLPTPTLINVDAEVYKTKIFSLILEAQKDLTWAGCEIESIEVSESCFGFDSFGKKESYIVDLRLEKIKYKRPEVDFRLNFMSNHSNISNKRKLFILMYVS